ncbi:MAG TPA: quinol:electron acceptor oxidoreductase subunit ActD [Bryobacteraceae bacterium]|nr:quinol:electron acceptor oxidoreductase subunit ActD [Bryobacteraceae bacterium]
MWLTAEFLSTEAAAGAVTALGEEGFSSREIELFSDRPVELPAGTLERRSHISLAAVLGAIVNGGLATLFIFFTQRNYRLVTGGMPVISGWSTGVISYELTMAGAVAGVVLALLWEGRLLIRRRRGAAPPALKEGSVYVRVECGEGVAAGAARRLEQAGAREIVNLPEAR